MIHDLSPCTHDRTYLLGLFGYDQQLCRLSLQLDTCVSSSLWRSCPELAQAVLYVARASHLVNCSTPPSSEHVRFFLAPRRLPWEEDDVVSPLEATCLDPVCVHTPPAQSFANGLCTTQATQRAPHKAPLGRSCTTQATHALQETTAPSMASHLVLLPLGGQAARAVTIPRSHVLMRQTPS